MFLYSAFETAKHLVAHPMGRSSKVLEALFTPPMPAAYMFGAKEIKAMLHVITRLNKEYHRPTWNIPTTLVEGKEYNILYEVVESKPFCNLLHFRKKDYRGPKLPTLLLVAPMSGHYPTLLRDTVKRLLPTHDVFITEWVNARDVPIFFGEFSLGTYVNYLIEFLQLLHKAGRVTHIMSVCQPTVPSLIAQSIMAENNDPALARSMIMIGGPIDARKSPTAVTLSLIHI